MFISEIDIKISYCSQVLDNSDLRRNKNSEIFLHVMPFLLQVLLVFSNIIGFLLTFLFSVRWDQATLETLKVTLDLALSMLTEL